MAKKQGLERFMEGEDNEGLSLKWLDSLGAALETSWVRLPTWYIELDIALRGGFPRGQNSAVVGAEHAGKTHMMLRLAHTMYNTCRKCWTPIIDWHNYETGEVKTTCKCGKKKRMRTIFVAAERRLDPAYAHKGFDLPLDDKAHFLIGYPKSGDFLTDRIEESAKSGRRVVDAFIVDSFASLFPEEMDGRRSSNAKVGAHAKMIQNLIFTVLRENHKLGSSQDGDITIVGTNQMRANLTMYGRKQKEAGGHAYRHMMTTNIYLNRPKINEKIDKKAIAEADSLRYADFQFKIDKATMGGGMNYVGSYRGYMQDYKGKRVGDSDEPERLWDWLEALKLAGKTKEGYEVLGITFGKKGEALQALRNKDMQWMARYPIFYATFPESAKPYLNSENYFYNPFYDAEVDHDVKGELEIAKVSLTGPRTKKGKKGTKSGGTKSKGKKSSGNNKKAEPKEESSGDEADSDNLFLD